MEAIAARGGHANMMGGESVQQARMAMVTQAHEEADDAQGAAAEKRAEAEAAREQALFGADQLPDYEDPMYSQENL